MSVRFLEGWQVGAGSHMAFDVLKGRKGTVEDDCVGLLRMLCGHFSDAVWAFFGCCVGLLGMLCEP